MCVASMNVRMHVYMLIVRSPVRWHFGTIDPHAVGVQAHVPDNGVVATVMPIVELAAGPVRGSPHRMYVFSVMYAGCVLCVVSINILYLHIVWHVWLLSLLDGTSLVYLL